MTNEFIESLTKITNSISRLPDKLSTPIGEKSRQEYATIFGTCILGQLEDTEYGYMTLPFQASLLTDPTIFLVGGGYVILDHPVKAELHEWRISNHIVSLNQTMSLYENRHPRLIALPRAFEEIPLSWMINRLMRFEFVGPFVKKESN